jgi:hypothetical protein
MTPLALAADLEAKHKALVEAQKSNPQQIAMRQLTLEFAFHNHFPTIIASLRQSGEAHELRRENEHLRRHLDEANHWREVLSNDLVAMSRLIPEPPRC